MERDYQRGKIYKLYIPGIDDFCYIGSTTNSLTERFAQHRFSAKCESQKKTAACQMFIDDEIEPLIELVEAFPCNSSHELGVRERYWIEQHKDCINSNTPTRTWKERWEANREHNLDLHKKWVEANKEKIAAYQEQYKPKRRANSAERRAAREKDPKAKEEFLKKRREIKNKEKICEKCGYKTTAGNFYRHSKVCDKA
jgi:hypothetical protein